MTPLTVFWILVEAERAFKAGARERGWALLEQAERNIPLIEGEAFFEAQVHANRVWAIASPELPIARVVSVGDRLSRVGV